MFPFKFRKESLKLFFLSCIFLKGAMIRVCCIYGKNENCASSLYLTTVNVKSTIHHCPKHKHKLFLRFSILFDSAKKKGIKEIF